MDNPDQHEQKLAKVRMEKSNPVRCLIQVKTVPEEVIELTAETPLFGLNQDTNETLSIFQQVICKLLNFKKIDNKLVYKTDFDAETIKHIIFTKLDHKCLESSPNVVILEPGANPNSDKEILHVAEMYKKDFALKSYSFLDIVIDEALFRRLIKCIAEWSNIRFLLRQWHMFKNFCSVLLVLFSSYGLLSLVLYLGVRFLDKFESVVDYHLSAAVGIAINIYITEKKKFFDKIMDGENGSHICFKNSYNKSDHRVDCPSQEEQITSQLRHFNEITVYTDGSCKDFDGQFGMGLGWIIPKSINPVENDIRFKCYADHFSSFTKAKLLAIITALTVVPLGSIVNVYTDSQNAINIVEEIISNRDRDIQWTKGKNIISRNAILHMIKDLDLTVQCYKVKAHSNDKYNEEADLLARITWNEIFSGKRIQINIQTFNLPMIIPLWRGTKPKKIHWKFTAKTIYPFKITTFKSNFGESKFRQFLLKLLNDELPTMNNLHKRKSWIYQSDKCPLCNTEIEDNIYVFTCQGFTNENPFKDLKEKFIRMTHFEANKVKSTLVLSSIRKKLQVVTENWENQKATAMEYS
ncbi:hypothetical protein Glove_519g40 [Diversispora epigaea]|uniref:RNase H type-1 domain-containing protein n=1 Tax=Diversispora epigaea TaxID=1348612 RepID=A0A397GF52_9GLOM|nr:hypothetical protein Glove_519g40 [Diversispora epigaea]